MLYITTRDNRDAHTAHKTLHTDTGIDGGAYVPFRMPLFTPEDMDCFVNAGFSETVATILNRFFSCGISVWDIDCCIGRNAVKTVNIPRRMIIAELWHNPKGTYDSVVSDLYKKIAKVTTDKPTEWVSLAVRIAFLFGIYVQMRNNDSIAHGEGFDISLPSDDFDIPVAAVYARMMGLPIETIICTGDENSPVWDFIHLGELNTALVGSNIAGYERYVFAALNNEGVKLLLEAIGKKRIYRVAEDQLEDFHKGMYCATAGKNRSAQTINSIYRSNQYILDPVSAICVGGLQDYRAKIGESKLTLVLSETSPRLKSKEIAEATGIPATKFADFV